MKWQSGKVTQDPATLQPCNSATLPPQTFPLSMTAVGETVRLVQIDAGKKLKHRLTELGLTPGVEVTIVQYNGGPLLLAVRDSRIAIGQGAAHKLRVALLTP